MPGSPNGAQTTRQPRRGVHPPYAALEARGPHLFVRVQPRGIRIAEQKALERIGFTREGVLREVAFRDGAWRDSVIYALLRKDWQGR
jgi:hypothetical protein